MARPKSGTRFDAYKITCSVNGNAYIGVTAQGVGKRFQQHMSRADIPAGAELATLLSSDVRRHGAEAFSVEHIAWARTFDDLLELEKLLIAEHGTLDPAGYNRTMGGEGMLGYRRYPTAAERENIRAKLTGRKLTEEHKQAIADGMRAITTDERQLLRFTRARSDLRLQSRDARGTVQSLVETKNCAHVAERSTGDPGDVPVGRAGFGDEAHLHAREAELYDERPPRSDQRCQPEHWWADHAVPERRGPVPAVRLGCPGRPWRDSGAGDDLVPAPARRQKQKRPPRGEPQGLLVFRARETYTDARRTYSLSRADALQSVHSIALLARSIQARRGKGLGVDIMMARLPVAAATMIVLMSISAGCPRDRALLAEVLSRWLVLSGRPS
jgi:hypothetical protein